MMKTLLVFASAIAMVTTTAGASSARVTDRGEYYQGTERNPVIGANNGRIVDQSVTGSVPNSPYRGEAKQSRKGGESEYFEGLQRD